MADRVPTADQAGEYVPIGTLRALRNNVDEMVRQAEVAAVDLPGELLEPFDGKGKVRPHSIRGWWQVWSGGLCIALLSDEDVAPILRTSTVSTQIDDVSATKGEGQ